MGRRKHSPKRLYPSFMGQLYEALANSDLPPIVHSSFVHNPPSPTEPASSPPTVGPSNNASSDPRSPNFVSSDRCEEDRYATPTQQTYSNRHGEEFHQAVAFKLEQVAQHGHGNVNARSPRLPPASPIQTSTMRNQTSSSSFPAGSTNRSSATMPPSASTQLLSKKRRKTDASTTGIPPIPGTRFGTAAQQAVAHRREHRREHKRISSSPDMANAANMSTLSYSTTFTGQNYEQVARIRENQKHISAALKTIVNVSLTEIMAEREPTPKIAPLYSQRVYDGEEQLIATRFSKVSIIVEGLQREPLVSHRAQMAVRTILLNQQVLKNVDAGRQVLNPRVLQSTRQLQPEAYDLLHEGICARIWYLEPEETGAAAARIIAEAFV